MIRNIIMVVAALACVAFAACGSDANVAGPSQAGIRSGKGPSVSISHSIISPRDPQSGLPTGQ